MRFEDEKNDHESMMDSNSSRPETQKLLSKRQKTQSYTENDTALQPRQINSSLKIARHEQELITLLKDLSNLISSQNEDLNELNKTPKPICFIILMRMAQSLLTISIAGELFCQKFDWDQLRDFAFGTTVTFDEKIPTEGFLDHLNINNIGTVVLATGINVIIIIGDSLGSLLTISPFSSLDNAITVITSGDPLTEEQWIQLNQNIANASGYKRAADLLFLQVLPILTSGTYFFIGSFTSPDGVKTLLQNSTATKALGWPLLAGATFFYISLYGPYLVQHIRRFRYEFYNPDFSFLKFIRNNKHISFEYGYQFSIVIALRAATSMFTADTALTDLPEMGATISYSPSLSLNIQWYALAVTIYSTLFTRFFQVKDSLIAKDIGEFQVFCENHQLKGHNPSWLPYGDGFWGKTMSSITSMARGFFPGWATGYLLDYHTHQYSQLAEEFQGAIAILGGLLIGGLFMWSYHKTLPQQSLIEAHEANKKIAKILKKLGDSLDYDFLIRGCQVYAQEIETSTRYEKSCKKNGMSVSNEFICLKKQLTKNYDKMLELKTSFEALLDLVAKFSKLIDNGNSTLDQATQQAFGLYTKYASKHGLSTGRLASVLATYTNLSLNLVRQISLVHFTIVLTVMRFGVSSDENNLGMLYNHALAFSVSSGLSFFINGLAVYQAPLQKRYEWIITEFKRRRGTNPMLMIEKRDLIAEMVENEDSENMQFLHEIRAQFEQLKKEFIEFKQHDQLSQHRNSMFAHSSLGHETLNQTTGSTGEEYTALFDGQSATNS